MDGKADDAPAGPGADDDGVALIRRSLPALRGRGSSSNASSSIERNDRDPGPSRSPGCAGRGAPGPPAPGAPPAGRRVGAAEASAPGAPAPGKERKPGCDTPPPRPAAKLPSGAPRGRSPSLDRLLSDFPKTPAGSFPGGSGIRSTIAEVGSSIARSRRS